MYPLKSSKEWRYMFLFGLVGLTNTAIDIGIFSLLFYTADVGLIMANSTGYIIAATNSFFMNKYWTFSSTNHQGKLAYQYLKFIALGLIGLMLSNIIVYSLAAIMPEILAKLLSVIVGFLWNFCTARFFVFR